MEEFGKEMNSTFLFNGKIHDLLSRIEICLSLPSTTNPIIPNASDLDTTSSSPQNNNHIDAKLPKLEIPKFNGKTIDKVFGISFPRPLIVKKIYPALLNFLI